MRSFIKQTVAAVDAGTGVAASSVVANDRRRLHGNLVLQVLDALLKVLKLINRTKLVIEQRIIALSSANRLKDVNL